MKNIGFEQIVHAFIAAANNFDTQKVLDLFTPDAVIEDVSVGEKFEQAKGIKKYFLNFFVGYHTSTQLLSIEQTCPTKIMVKVDFKGDFGHETGGLAIRISNTGLTEHIHAYLD